MKKIFSNLFRFPVLFAVIFSFFNSCLDDRYDFNKLSDEIQINPKLTLPVAFGSLTVKDILNEADDENNVKEYDDKLLYITYSEKLLSYLASEIINVPDQHFTTIRIDSTLNIPDWLSGELGESVNIRRERNVEFVFSNNERLDSLFLRHTVMHIELTSTFRHTGTLTITSPDIKNNNGTPFSTIIQIGDVSGNFTYTTNINLNDVKVILDNDSDPDTSFLPLVFDLHLINSGAGISENESCNISISCNNIDFYSIFGYMGNYEILEENGNIEINLFDTEDQEGKLNFYDPKIFLNINNSYGVPVSIELSEVATYSEKNDAFFPITFTEQNPFDISAPLVPGGSSKTEMTFDRSISNIADAIDKEPSIFFYKAKAITNPDGLTNRINFVTDTSRIDVDFQIMLPIWIKADGFTLKDTVDFDFDKEMGDVAKFINYLRITLEADNGIPLEIDMQVYFTDSLYTVLDTMFTENKVLLESAPIGTDDKVTGKTSVTRKVEFTDDKLERLKPVKYAIISAKANTAKLEENRYVKIMSDNFVDFRLKLKADLTINSRD